MVNWVKVLAKDGSFTPTQRIAATFWSSCAIGEAHQKFPEVVIYQPARYPDGESSPTDQGLWDLGYQFYVAVTSGDRPEARKLYRLIQKSVAKLAKGK